MKSFAAAWVLIVLLTPCFLLIRLLLKELRSAFVPLPCFLVLTNLISDYIWRLTPRVFVSSHDCRRKILQREDGSKWRELPSLHWSGPYVHNDWERFSASATAGVCQPMWLFNLFGGISYSHGNDTERGVHAVGALSLITVDTFVLIS